MDLPGLMFLIFAPLGYVIYRFLFRYRNYFEKRGVKYEKPSIFYGNIGDVMKQKLSGAENITRFYKKFSGEKAFGFFNMMDPTYMICDPELIKKVCVTDFQKFHDHGYHITEEADPILGNQLIVMQGKKWKEMRSTMSPAFTTSKLKIMFGFIENCAKQFCDHLGTEPNQLEMKETFSKLILNIISTCAFGIELNTFEDPEHIFYKFAKKMTQFFTDPIAVLKFMAYYFCPKVMKLLNIKLLDTKTAIYFMQLIKDAIDQREANGTIRPDMLHLLIEAQKAEGSKWTNNELTAQCVTFLGAGFETSATLLSFLTFELSSNPEVQTKVFEEIAELNLEDKISYENLNSLKYMDMVISETLRLWPPFTAVDRACSENYLLKSDDGSFAQEVEKGYNVWIPIYPIHRDPKYFEDPDEFKPERFSESNIEKITPYTYLPFGVGNRNCLGNRFALMQTKIILYHLIKNFKLELGSKMEIPLKISPSSFLLAPKDGFWITMRGRGS